MTFPGFGSTIYKVSERNNKIMKNKKCKENYVGETARRKVKRVEEHAGRDKNSHIFQHSNTTKHPRAKEENFEILATNYPNKRKRKLAEAMYIRDIKPTLNKQKTVLNSHYLHEVT